MLNARLVEALADGVAVAGWAIILSHNAWLAARGVRGAPGRGRWIAGLVVAAIVITSGAVLERGTGGRLAGPAPLRAASIALVGAGTLLHLWARITLGHAWTARTDRAGSRLVDDGPYRYVRHPLYVGVLLLGTGTVLAHPSAATLAGGLGLVAGTVLKVRAEERTLAQAFGARWTAYRARVGCIVPRLGRGARA